VLFRHDSLDSGILCGSVHAILLAAVLFVGAIYPGCAFIATH
jgi:hypothetical protein